MNKSKILLLLMMSGSILTTSAISSTTYADSINASQYAISDSSYLDNTDALDKINAGTADYSDYEALNLISSQDEADIYGLNMYVQKEKKALRKSYLSKEEIENVVTDVIKNTKTALYTIAHKRPLETSYFDYLGINIQEYQITAINECCFKCDAATLSEVKECANKAIDSLDKINQGTADYIDYQNINIDINEKVIDLSSLTQHIAYDKSFLSIKNLSRDDILKTVASLADNTCMNLERISSKHALEPNEFLDFGIDLKPYQLDAVNECCFKCDAATLSEVKECANKAIDSLDKINQGTADYIDYQNISIDINEEIVDLNSLTQRIKDGKSYSSSTVTSRSDIIKALSSLIEDTKEALTVIESGNANLTDYAVLGINLKEYQLSAVNSYCFLVDSSRLTLIKNNASVAVNSIDKINRFTADFSDYQKLDFNFTEDDLDLSVLKNRIKEQRFSLGHYLSKDEIYMVISNLINDTNIAIDKISCNNSTTLEDYALLGIKLKDYQLSATNSYCFNTDCSNVNEIKTCVKEAVNALNRINRGSTNISDYEILDIDFSKSSIDITALALRIKQERASLGHYLSKEEINSLINF